MGRQACLPHGLLWGQLTSQHCHGSSGRLHFPEKPFALTLRAGSPSPQRSPEVAGGTLLAPSTLLLLLIQVYYALPGLPLHFACTSAHPK